MQDVHVSMRRLAAIIVLCLAAGLCVRAVEHFFWTDEVEEHVGATSFHSHENCIVVRNLWFHVTHFKAIVPWDEMARPTEARSPDLPISETVSVQQVPVLSVDGHVSNLMRMDLKAQSVLWLDHPRSATPGVLGIWEEILFPIHSALLEGRWPRADGGPELIDAVVLPSLRRDSLMAFPAVWELLLAALAPVLPDPTKMPPLIFFDDLAALPGTHWLRLPRVVEFTSRYVIEDQEPGFWEPEHGRAFREAAYRLYGTPLPELAPRRLTYVMSASAEAVSNNGEVMAMLQRVARRHGLEFWPYTASPGVSVASLTAVASRSGVLVVPHGSLAALGPLLPPGSAAVELQAFGPPWRNARTLYADLAASVGDVYLAHWRAGARETELAAGDEKYSRWPAQDCVAGACADALARAATRVDAGALERVLEELLGAVRAGETPAGVRARTSWPLREGKVMGKTGLWWEVE